MLMSPVSTTLRFLNRIAVFTICCFGLILGFVGKMKANKKAKAVQQQSSEAAVMNIRDCYLNRLVSLHSESIFTRHFLY